MLQLPNGCKCSNPSVFPKNWKTSGASISKDWRIQFYFYDPVAMPKGKLFVIKGGINKFKTLSERRTAVGLAMEELLLQLQSEGYNPISGSKETKPCSIDELHLTPFTIALQQAFERTVMCDDMRTDVKSMMKYFVEAAEYVGAAAKPVGEVRRRHILLILERCQTSRKLSNARYNKYRSYLYLIFQTLDKWEYIEGNFIDKISILKHTTKIREILTPEQCIRVDNYLRKKTYTFWRFMHIFFQSAGRIKEILRVKVKDVNLQQQCYKVTIHKGNNAREVMRPINETALPMWQELLAGHPDAEAYIFHEQLLPGVAGKPIRREQITRRWETHVKRDLKITADFYSLKALFLELVARGYDINTSKDLADHKSVVVTMKHYATGEGGRELDKKKKIKISFTA